MTQQRPRDYIDFIRQERDKEGRGAFYCPVCFRLKVLCKCPVKPEESIKKTDGK